MRTGRRVRGTTNVSDPANKQEIRQVQLAKSYLGSRKVRVWKRQGALCPKCHGLMDLNCPELLDLHHIVPKVAGGSDRILNLELVHEHCHTEIHRQRAQP